MKTNKQQIERALQAWEMIEGASNIINNLQQDLANINNPSKEFDKVRLMLDEVWINKQLRKYEAIKSRLLNWYRDIISRLNTTVVTLSQQQAA